jgi:hypothetical protein
MALLFSSDNWLLDATRCPFHLHLTLAGRPDWAPIMGDGYSANTTQWCKGE